MEEQKIVYHGSNKPGLTRLEPFECRHGKPYVYATKYYNVVLFFAAKGQGMFDGWTEDDENGIPTYYEAYPDALKKRYWGQKSYCYKLPADTFSDATGNDFEVVSEVPVDIIGCDVIEDVGLEFERLIREGKYRMVPYNTSPKNTKEICEKRALDILIDRGYFEGNDFRQREWASEYYKDLIEDYINKNNIKLK